MAVAFSIGAKEVAFFLKCDRARLDRAHRFADCCGKIFLGDHRIRCDHAKDSKLFQSAVQSAIIALWICTLDSLPFFLKDAAESVSGGILLLEDQVLKETFQIDRGDFLQP